MILDDIQAEVERQAEEMQIEGINAVDHFARRIGVSREELLDFVEERAGEMYELRRSGRGVKETLMIGYMDAMAKGFALGRRSKK